MAMDRKREGAQFSERIKRMGKLGLSAKRLRFIDEYMKDHKPVEAAMRAGYTEKSAKLCAGKNLKIQAVKDEIARRDIARTERLDIKDDDILRPLVDMAKFDVRSMFDKDTGKLITNPHEMNEDQVRALVNFSIVVLNKEGDYIVQLNPGNKLKALELLGKHRKLWTDRVEHSGAVVNYNTDFGEGDKPADN